MVRAIFSHFHNSNALVPGHNTLCMQPRCFGISPLCLRLYIVLLRCPYGFQYWLCTFHRLAGSRALSTIIPNPHRHLNKNQLQLISGKRHYLQELTRRLWQLSFYLSFTENYLNAKFWADYLKCTELESSKLAQVIFRLFLIFLMQWLVKKSILPHSWGLQDRHQTRLVSMEHVSPHSSLILKLTTLIWAQD